MAAAFRGKTTKAEARERSRKEKQDELGVCRIRRIAEDQRSQILGSGFVVKDLQIFPGLSFSYCLISSDKVFPKDDCNIKSYFLDFTKLESTGLETVELKHVAAKSTDFTRTSGLVLIPINPSKKCNKNRSIFTYRPFKVANVGIAPGEDLKCCFVDDDSGQTNFAFVGLALKRSEAVSTQYQLHEVNEPPYTKYDDIIDRGDHRKPYGAVILKPSNKEFMAVGALTFTDNECRNICCAFFPLPLVTQTSEPFPDDSEHTVPDGEQHVSVDNAPSNEVESPVVASTETSEPFPDDSEHPVPGGDQQVAVASAPSNEVESPGVASIGTDAFKGGKPSDLELDDLALQIGAKWKRIGIRLGISNDVLDEIVANTEDKPFQMLLHWRNTTTSATPYRDIYNALCHIRVGLNNVAKEFCWKRSSRTFLKRDLPYPSEHHTSAKRSRSAGKRSSRSFLKRDLPHPSEHHTSAKRSRSAALKLRIDVDTMELAEHSTQDRTASAIESEGSQGGEHQVASAVPVSSGQTQASCTGDEVHQTPNPILTKEYILCLIAANYLQNSPPRCKADRDDFMAYVKEMGLIITGVSTGSLLITVKCDSLQILERLWEDYSCDHLGEVVQRCFVTEEILTELGLVEVKLKTTISEEEYKACKKYLSKDPGRGQCGNVAVPDEQPIHVHFPDEEHLFQLHEDDDGETERVEEELKTGTDEGFSVSKDEEADDDKVSVSDDEGLLRTKGSVWDRLSKKRELTSRTLEEQPYREEEKTPGVVMQKTSKPGLLRTRGSVWQRLSKKRDLTSRTPEEQPCRKEEKTPGVVMQKTSKPGLLRTRGSVWERLSKKRDLTSRTPEEQPCRKEEKTPETSEPFPDGSEHPVPDGEQQVSVDSAPSNEVEYPGVASTETSQPFPDGSEHPVPDGEQQGSVASAPSNEIESPGVESTALDVRVDVDTLKRKEHNTQDRTVSAIESEGVQGGEHQAAPAVPGQTQEAHQAPNPIEVLCKIADNYLHNSPPKTKADRDDFVAYMKEMHLKIP